MRTPEEIKKGLACCAKPFTAEPCRECPYNKDCGVDKPNNACADAFAYINQLEEKIAKRDKLLAVMGVRIREDKEHENA